MRYLKSCSVDTISTVNTSELVATIEHRSDDNRELKYHRATKLFCLHVCSLNAYTMYYLFDVQAASNRNYYGAIPSNPRSNHPAWVEDLKNDQAKEKIISIDDAIELLGIGRFQYQILIASGLLMAADSIETVLLSYLSKVFNKNEFLNNDGLMDDREYEYETLNPNSITSIVFPGAILGALVLGSLGDLIGRRKVFCMTASIIAIFGVGTAVVNSYEWLLAARFMVGFGVGGVTVPFDSFSEFLPSLFRARQLLYTHLFWTAGALLVHIALEQLADNDSWRVVVVLCAIPCVLATILGFLVVPESPRWLLAKGKHEEAVEILRSAARMNGMNAFELFPEGIILYTNEPRERFSDICNLCSSRWMKITSTLWTTYFGLEFMGHGTLSLAISVFSHDQRQQDYQVIFSATSKFLGVLVVLLTIDKMGRIPTQCVAYACGGATCLLVSLILDNHDFDYPNLLLVLAFLARMFVFSGACTTWVSTTEVLATEIRSSRHAMANAIGRIGDFLSTYMLTNITSLPTIGLVLFVMSIWTVATSSGIPETCVKEMGVAHHHFPSFIARRDGTRYGRAACRV